MDALYCEEEWEDELVEGGGGGGVTSQVVQVEQEYYSTCEDGEIPILLAKEQQQRQEKQKQQELANNGAPEPEESEEEDSCPSAGARSVGVQRILNANAHHGFSALTALLAVDYFDRFLVSSCPHFHTDKPWFVHLAAVTCLSLAAKVEEPHVPLLLDLQLVGDTKYVFDAKTIQKMELLLLSKLEWRMNPVTPLSFLDHIVPRLRIDRPLRCQFLRRCHRLLLSVATHPSFPRFLPSVVATAAMMRVIEELGPRNGVEFQTQLEGEGMLEINEEVNGCYRLTVDLSSASSYSRSLGMKRTRCHRIPGSPNGVMDACLSCGGDSSGDAPKKSKTREQSVGSPALEVGIEPPVLFRNYQLIN